MSVDNRSARRPPEPAKVEEYDEKEDVVKAGTAVHAHADRPRATSQAPLPKPLERKQTQPEPTSDSGYASRSTAAGAPMPVAKTAASSTRKPVIHRHDSAQGKFAEPKPCKGDCDHPGCRAIRNPERRYTLTRDQRPEQPYHAQPPPTQQPFYPPPQSYQYHTPLQIPPGAVRQPVLAAGPRQRALSSTGQPRPSSYHAGYTAAPTYTSHYGPPASPSAYHYSAASYYHQAPYHPQPQPASYLASTPPSQGMMTYPVHSPITPTSRALAGGAPLMSARAPINPDLPGLVHRPALTHGPMIRRPSARQQAPLHAVPGRYIEEESTEESIYSGTESDYCSSDEEDQIVTSTRRMSLDRRDRAREDRERMPPPLSRRPSNNQRHLTAPALVTRVTSSREQFRPRPERARHSATDADLSAADHFDSDRTVHAVVSRRPDRTNSTYSGQSRRQSLSTSATASDQTPATSYSGGSGSRHIVEDRHGRRREYLSRDDRVRNDRRQDELLRTKVEEDRARERLYKQRDTAARVEEYQRRAAAGVVADNYEELSAEKINQSTAKQRRRISGSHISHHSRKSSSSNKTGAVKISSGGTEVHVYGDTNVTVEANEDGNGTRLIIGSRETSYHGSSRDSKHGRSRGGSDIHTRPIREEDGYESAC